MAFSILSSHRFLFYRAADCRWQSVAAALENLLKAPRSQHLITLSSLAIRIAANPT